MIFCIIELFAKKVLYSGIIRYICDKYKSNENSITQKAEGVL